MVEILPGEEKRSGLLFVGEPHGMKCGEIIGFFVDVHNLRAQLAHDLAQSRVIMQVKVAIESHWGNNHLVTRGIETFKHLLAAVVTLPVGRSDEG